MRLLKSTFISIFALLGTLVLGAPTTHAQSPVHTRGFYGDLSDPADTFLSADLNGDGRADLLYYRPGGGFAGAYLSHGDGTFRYVSYTSGGKPSNGFPGDLSTASDTFVVLDLNGDGKQDFIQYRPGQGYTIRCLSQGDGTVLCDELSVPGVKSSNFQDDMSNTNTRILALPRRGASAQFLVYTPGGAANLYIQQAGSTNLQYASLTGNPVLAPGLAATVNSSNLNIVPLDANGDGYSDLFVYASDYANSSTTGIATLYINNGNNSFSAHTLSVQGKGYSGFTGNPQDPHAHAIALDLDGDGRQDILWWQAGSHIVTGFLSNGDNSFQAVNYQSSGSGTNGFDDDAKYYADTAVALDLNGDGKQDFIWYSPGNSPFTLYESVGTASAPSTRGAIQGASLRGSDLGTNTPQGHVLALNFLGQPASGFVSYVPGSGANGTPFINAYTLAVTDPNASNFGKLNTYSFLAYPGNFLSDLNWSIGNVPLKAIVMPGTHDSSMYGLNTGVADYRETQLGDYTYQLGFGARAFDFRMGYLVSAGLGKYADPDGNSYTLDTSSSPSVPDFLMTGHGNTATGYRTVDVLNTLENWLMQHPNEVVILYMVESIAGSTSGHTANYVQQFANVLNSTTYPGMIYTQQLACGAALCTDPRVQPQNMTVNKLQQVGPLANGARLILVNGDSRLTALGWQWGTSASAQVGYCTDTDSFTTYSGTSDPSSEINCINNGSLDPSFPSTKTSLREERTSFQAADAAPQFTPVVAALTEFAYFKDPFTALEDPIELADGPTFGFNVGTSSSDLNNELANGEWRTNALNTFSIDGMGQDNVVPLLLQRNNQTWVDTHFFNNNVDTPAGALSIGANGDVWAAGTGHSIALFKYNRANGIWTDVVNGQPNVKKLAVDPQGGVYLIDGSLGINSNFGRLLHYDKNGANENSYSETVQDVAVGQDGSVWISANGQVSQLLPGSGLAFSTATHPGTHVAVDNLGRPWVTQSNGQIYRYVGNAWVQVAAANGTIAGEIVASAEGSIFVAEYAGYAVFRYNPQTDGLDPFIMDALHIAVEPGGQPWAIRTATGVVYKGSVDQM